MLLKTDPLLCHPVDHLVSLHLRGVVAPSSPVVPTLASTVGSIFVIVVPLTLHHSVYFVDSTIHLTMFGCESYSLVTMMMIEDVVAVAVVLLVLLKTNHSRRHHQLW